MGRHRHKISAHSPTAGSTADVRARLVSLAFAGLGAVALFGLALPPARAQDPATAAIDALKTLLEDQAREHNEQPSDNDPTRNQSPPPAPYAAPEQPQEQDEPAPADAEQIIEVGLDNRITLHVANLPLGDALRMLSEPTRKNIVLADGATGSVSATLYDVTFDEALDAMLVSNGLGYRTQGDFVYVYPLETLARIEQANRKYETRVFRLTYVTAASVRPMVELLLSAEGRVSVTPPANVGLGGEAGLEDTEGDASALPDAIVVSDYADRLEQVESVIHQLDQKPRQVLIEATILRASLNEDNALGIDFTTVGGVDFESVNSVSPAAQSIATGNIPQAELNNTNFTVRTDFNAALPAGGFTFGIVKDQISVFIRALEEITDTDVLANPKLLVLNKQVGQVIVGRRDGYLTTTITETTATQTVEFLETGTVLTLRPFIGDDGYVRLEVHPKDSTGGLTQTDLPFEQTTEVTTNIMVRDGQTILIGGLFREVGTVRRGQTPLLGNIPIAGALFRSTGDNTMREEVIILLTVHIIHNEADSLASQQLRQDIERFRVGMRRGMQWFGRERLAQTHYQWATDNLAAGDLDKALWNAELAMHNYPRHIHAQKLREQILRRRLWESEGSAVRCFVRDRILDARGVSAPDFGRPGPPFHVPDDITGPTGFSEIDEPLPNDAQYLRDDFEPDAQDDMTEIKQPGATP